MSVARVMEISATSPESFEHAIQEGVESAADRVDRIKGVWVKEQHVDVDGSDIVDYRVDMKVTYILEE